MKHTLLILSLVLLTGCDEANSKNARFIVEKAEKQVSNDGCSPHFHVITDKETGTQYLASSDWIIELKKPVDFD